MNTNMYQPYLIGEGKQTAGLFTYLDSWIKPQTAYDLLVNAYIYRGSLYQRNGFTLFPSVPAAGALLYQNNEIVATGNTGTSYNGILANFPLIATATITARTGAVIRTSTATFAAGNVNWSTGGASLANSGTINFTTGVWNIVTSSAVANNIPITIQYTFVPTNSTTPLNRPIMGIKQFINETTDTNVLLVLDTRRASYWDSGTSQFQPISQFQQYFYQIKSPNTGPSVTVTPSVNVNWTNITTGQAIAPYTVTIQSSGDALGNGTVTDVPTNAITGTFGADGNILSGTIDYTTGLVTITFNAAPTERTLLKITGSMRGDYFNGDNSNFFNATNWDAPDSPAYLYVTNNVDPITLFNGTILSRPAFALYKASVTVLAPSQVLLPFRNDIAKALDVQVFQDRLLIIRPTIYTSDLVGRALKPYAENQAIYYSGRNSPLNLSFSPQNLVLATEIAGNGGFEQASTGDIIQCEELIRDVLVVFFTNSTWILRYTANPTEPFRFYRLNVSRSTNAPYGSIAYDVTASSMGAKGLIESDGVGVERYDEDVIDVFEDINQNAFGQCFAQKYDAQNQSWMLYPSTDNNSSTSDKIIVYNYLEKTWAIYEPNMGALIADPTKPNTLSCLGLGFTTKDLIWNDFAPGGKYGPNGLTWDQANFTWNSHLEQDLSPSLLAGDQNGFVYVADDGPFDQIGPQTATPNPIPTQIITMRLNPFIQNGLKATFGYLDIYYQANDGGQIRVNIYGNNSSVIYKTFLFTLDAPTNSGYNWKRFYLNITAEFIQVEFNSLISDTLANVPVYNPAPPFKILGMLLWAMPGGRLTPGTFL